jgi:hypothetical protein
VNRRLLFLLGLVALYNLFLYHAFGSTGFVLAAMALYVFVLGVFWHKKLPVLPTIFVGLLGAAMIRSANGLVNFVDGLTILVTIFLTGYLLSAKKTFFAGIGELILSPVAVAWSYLRSVLDIFRLPKKGFLPIVRGLVIALPVFLVMVGLLAAGDPIYNHFLVDLIKNIQRLVTHIIFSAVLLTVLLPYALIKFRELPKKIYSWTLAIATEVNILIGLIVVALGSFLVIQWPYVFINVAAETSLTKFGVATYSEYVKRGFGEFVLVALIVYGLAWAGILVKKVSPWLQALLFGEFAVFVVSVFRRIALYQQYHGWTLARIYGGIFLLWVTGLMAILFWRYLSRKNLLSAELIFTAIVILIFSWFNAENFVAPTVNGRPDYVYLSRLSADGFSGWEKSLDYADRVLSTNQNKSFFNKESRREIAYANIIVHSADDHLVDLQRKYAANQSLLDKIFQFNLSEYLALKPWGKMLSGGEIKAMETKYAELNWRIQSQPENERDWDFDISMETPFL